MMRLKYLLVAVATLFCGTTAHSDTPELGIHFYEMKNYKVALPLVKMGAEDGHADAQFTLGLMYAY